MHEGPGGQKTPRALAGTGNVHAARRRSIAVRTARPIPREGPGVNRRGAQRGILCVGRRATARLTRRSLRCNMDRKGSARFSGSSGVQRPAARRSSMLNFSAPLFVEAPDRAAEGPDGGAGRCALRPPAAAPPGLGSGRSTSMGGMGRSLSSGFSVLWPDRRCRARCPVRAADRHVRTPYIVEQQ